jgi:hypothetical protein
VSEATQPERPELSSSGASGGYRGDPQTFYRYETKGGKVVIVDSLSKLPPEAREHAERLELGLGKAQPAIRTELPAPTTTHSAPAPPGALDPEQSQGATRGDSASHGRAEGAEPGVRPAFSLDASSFGLGLGAGVLGALALMMLAGRAAGDGAVQRWLVRGALFVSVVVLGTSAYLGWTRQHAGLGGSALASPKDLLRDAQGAVEQVKQRRAEQEQKLEELERLAR